jgi:Mg2+/citrate symporter
MQPTIQWIENLASSILRFLSTDQNLKAIGLVVSVLSLLVGFQSLRENRRKRLAAEEEKRKAEKELEATRQNQDTERRLQELKLQLANDVLSIRSTMSRKYERTFFLFLVLYAVLGLYMKNNLDRLRTAKETATAASEKAQTAIDLATPKQPVSPSVVKSGNGSSKRKHAPSKSNETPRPNEQPN